MSTAGERGSGRPCGSSRDGLRRYSREPVVVQRRRNREVVLAIARSGYGGSSEHERLNRLRPARIKLGAEQHHAAGTRHRSHEHSSQYLLPYRIGGPEVMAISRYAAGDGHVIVGRRAPVEYAGVRALNGDLR